MAFEIRYAAEAENDLNEILSWLVKRQAGKAGLRWYQGLEKKISTLAEMPGRCVRAPESKSLSFDLFQLLYGRKPRVYRVLFTIQGNVVYILAIRRPRENSFSLS